MKKWIAIVLIVGLLIVAVGCRSAAGGAEICAAMKDAETISGIYTSCGNEREFLGNRETAEWFCKLKLKPCESPEDVEGAETYSFALNGETAVIYQKRSEKEAYVFAGGMYYRVLNSSDPPVLVE